MPAAITTNGAGAFGINLSIPTSIMIMITPTTQPITWTPTTLERYDEALNVLPPIAWCSKGFLLGEPCDSDANGRPRYDAYRQTGDQFFVSDRPLTVAEWRAV